MNNAILLVAVLVCPITMGTMMFFMMRGQKKKDNADSDKSDNIK
jgi:preprotein translocase subunit YajC